MAKSITGHIYHVVKDEDQRAALARVEAGFAAIPHKSRASGTDDLDRLVSPSRNGL